MYTKPLLRYDALKTGVLATSFTIINNESIAIAFAGFYTALAFAATILLFGVAQAITIENNVVITNIVNHAHSALSLHLVIASSEKYFCAFILASITTASEYAIACDFLNCSPLSSLIHILS